MMFVKYCPDPSLAALLRFKVPEKWTAGEIQEHFDRYQIDMREQLNSRPYCPGPASPVTAQVQTSVSEEVSVINHLVSPPVQANTSVTSAPQFDDNCLKTLISLLDHTLAQNSQAMAQNSQQTYGGPPFGQSQNKHCKVCKSAGHSTMAHCRRERLCLSCFKPGHVKKDCPHYIPGRENRENHLQSSSL